MGSASSTLCVHSPESLPFSLTLLPRPTNSVSVDTHTGCPPFALPEASWGGSLLWCSIHFLQELICSSSLLPIFLQDAQMLISSPDLLLDSSLINPAACRTSLLKCLAVAVNRLEPNSEPCLTNHGCPVHPNLLLSPLSLPPFLPPLPPSPVFSRDRIQSTFFVLFCFCLSKNCGADGWDWSSVSRAFA